MYGTNWRLCHPVNIYVFKNGQEGIPAVLVHVPTDKKRSMDAVLRTIGDRVKFPIGYPFALYHMTGDRVCETWELEAHGHYVVSSNLDKLFKHVCYGETRPPMVVVGAKSKNVRNMGMTMKDFLRISNKENTKMKYILGSSITKDGYGPTELPYFTRPSKECGALCQKKYSCRRDPCDNATRLKYVCCPPESLQPEPTVQQQCYCEVDGAKFCECDCNDRGDNDIEWCKSGPLNCADLFGTIEPECKKPEMPNADNMCLQNTVDPCCQNRDKIMCVQAVPNPCEREITLPPPPPPPPVCEPTPQEIDCDCVKEDPPSKPPMTHASVNTEPYVAETVEECQPECVVKIVNRKLDVGADLYRMFNCRLLSDNPHPIPKSSCKTASQPAKDTRVSDDFYRKFCDKLNETISQPFESADIEAEFLDDSVPVPAEEPEAYISSLENNVYDFKMPPDQFDNSEKVEEQLEQPEPDKPENIPSIVVHFNDSDQESTDFPDRDELLTVVDEILSTATDRANSSYTDYNTTTEDESSYFNTTSVEETDITFTVEETDTTFTVEETDTTFTVEESGSTTVIESLDESPKNPEQFSKPAENSDAEEYGAPPDDSTGESISAILGTVPPDPETASSAQAYEPSANEPTTEPTSTRHSNNPNAYFMTVHQMNNPFRISSDGNIHVNTFPHAVPLTQNLVYGTPYRDYLPREDQKLKNDGKVHPTAVVDDCRSSSGSSILCFENLQTCTTSSDDDIDYLPQDFLDELRTTSFNQDLRIGCPPDFNRYTDKNSRNKFTTSCHKNSTNNSTKK